MTNIPSFHEIRWNLNNPCSSKEKRIPLLLNSTQISMKEIQKKNQTYQVIDDEELGQVSGGGALTGTDPCEQNRTEESCLSVGCRWQSSDNSCHRRGIQVL